MAFDFGSLRRSCGWLFCTLLTFAAWAIPSPPTAMAQRTARLATIEPELFGFDIPNGRVRAGEGRRLLTRDDAGRMVVAQIHVEVGEHVIVMLPDGQLVARHKAQTQGTTDPFAAAKKEDIAERMTSGEFTGFRSRSTNRFLYIYNTSEPFVTVASRILETMFPGVVAYAQAQKIEVHAPEVPLVVVMFRDENEFRQFTGAGGGVVAFYDIINNRVSMYEKSALDELAPTLAAQELVSTIAHEGAHQILANVGVQQRLSIWPMWLSEGMAEFFAATSTDKRFKWKGAGEPNDMRMFELERFMARTSFNSNGETFAVTVEAPRLTSTGYASAWSLTHFLAKQRREQFNQYVNEVSRLGPLEGHRSADGGRIKSNRELFTKHFGEDFGTLEQQIVKHLNGLPYKRPFGL